MSINITDVTDKDVTDTLRIFGGKICKEISENPKLLKNMIDLVKGVVKSNALEVVSAAASINSSVLKKTEAPDMWKYLAKGGSTTLSITKVSMSLVHVAKLTNTGAILAVVGAATVQKTGIALSLVGDDNNRIKCTGALMELGGTLTATAIVGIPSGGVLISLTALSIVAQIWSAYDACQKE